MLRLVLVVRRTAGPDRAAVLLIVFEYVAVLPASKMRIETNKFKRR